MKHSRKIRFLILLIVLKTTFINKLFSQTQEEKQIEQKAIALFNQKKFGEALPLFSQLLSLYPQDDRYNFYYGASLVETNQLIEKAINYLKFADSKSNNPFIKYYLGRAYHLNYQFNDAIEYYNEFLNTASSKDAKEYNVRKLIEMCQSGKELLKYISELTVVDNRRIKSENYFYSYDLKEFDGRLIIKPKELKTSVDKKEEAPNTVIFLPNNSDVVYYGSYGNTKANGRDIYRVKRLPDGTWGKPERLSSVINTPYDEDYPYLYNDGKTLYFSSKGHNSMGGYDIFMSEFDSSSNEWTKPVNLDFPINTPYDDYLYIPDKENFYAFFTSNRETRDNNITVYKIIVDKNPQKREYKDLEEIKNISKLNISSIAQIKKAEESKRSKTESTGDINLVDVGKQSNAFSLTPYTFKPIEYKPDLSVSEVSNNLKADNEKIAQRSKEIKRQSTLAYLTAKEKNEKANEKRRQAYQINTTIPNIKDPVEAEQQKQKVYQLIDEAEDLERQAITAFNIAQNLEQIAAEMDKDVSKSQGFINALEKQQSVDEAIVDAANKNKERLELSQKKYATLNKAYDERKNLLSKKEEELLYVEQVLSQTNDSLKEISQKIDKLENRIKNTSSETEKSMLSAQLDNLNNYQYVLNAKQLELLEQQEKIRIDIDNLKSENEFIKQFADVVKNDNRSIDELTKESIDKNSLKKEIFEKELNADITIAETIKKKVEEIKPEQTIQEKPESKTTEKKQQTKKQKDDTLISQNTVETGVQEIKNNSSTSENSLKTITNKLMVNTQTNEPTVENLQKEEYNLQYYTNIVNEQQKKLDIIDNAIAKTKNKKEKQSLEEQRQSLVEELTTNKKILESTKQKINQYKNTLASVIDTAIKHSDEEIVLSASKYDNKYEIKFSLAQQQNLENAKQVQNNLKETYQQLQENAKEINRLEKLKYTVSNNSEQKNIENQIQELKTNYQQQFREYTQKVNNANKLINDVYSQILSSVRMYNYDNPNAKAANLVEKEIDVLKDRSVQLKKEAIATQNEQKQLELFHQADLIDQIIAEKQKYAIDLYISAREETTSKPVLASVKPEEESSKKEIEQKDVAVKDQEAIPLIEISPELNKQINQYKAEEAKADLKYNQAKQMLKEIEEQKQLANRTYSKSKQKEILQNIEAKEEKMYNTFLEANEIYEKSNQSKYTIYNSEINKLLENPNVLENNKIIASQFLKEADFYFNEAQKLRLSAKAAATKEDQIAIFDKALMLEKKALSNQDYAIEALTNTEPVEFVATNNLIKIDRLEALDNPVNVDDIVRIRTERIISNLNLTEEERQKLDEANINQQTIKNLLDEASQYESKLNLAKEKAKNSTNDAERKKASKQIPKLEKEYFARKFTAAELTEKVNDNLYNLYDSKLSGLRSKNANEAKQGKQLEKNANKYYIQAKQLRDKSFITNDPYLAYNYLLQADSLEKLAIEEQERALGIYLKLKPLEEEIAEYAKKHPQKQPVDELIVINTPASITPLTKEEVQKIEQEVAQKEKQQLINNQDTLNFKPVEKEQDYVAENQIKTSQYEKNSNVNNENYQNITNDTAKDQQNITIKWQEEKIQQQKQDDLAEKNKFENNEQQQKLDETNKSQEKQVETNNISTGQEKQNQLLSNVNEEDEIRNVNSNQTITNESTTTESNVIIKPGGEEKTSELIVPKNIKTPMGFAFYPASLYSEANPIPINPPLPEGLVFKVQIGAFVAPVSPNAFKGLSPLTAEKLEGSKYYRYFVGMFYSEAAAILVRDFIRPMGYNDAFVVAFYNGKRIPLYEARQLIKQYQSSAYEQLAQQEQAKIKQVTSVSPELLAKAENTNKAERALNTESKTTLGQIVNNSKELFYTVQVGVYKNPITADVLKNLSPVYEDHSYGFIRYLIGKYQNRALAEEAKKQIVNAGITDAFVSAYYNGQKITLAEAAQIEAMNPKALITTSDNVNITGTNIDETSKKQEVELTNINIQNLYYRIQLGSFKEKVPFDKAAKFIEISNEYSIEQVQENNTTIYYAGKYKSYTEALTVKNKLVNQGFTDAFVVATDGKVRITIEQAKKLLGQ